MARNSKDFTFDAALQLKDAGAVIATGVGQVAAANKILTLGAGRVDARAIVDIASIDTTSGDESYRIRLQGSTDSGFASGVVELAALEVGVASTTGDTAADGVSRHELAFTNEVNGVVYPFCRVAHVIAGTTPSIDYRAYVVQAPL